MEPSNLQPLGGRGVSKPADPSRPGTIRAVKRTRNTVEPTVPKSAAERHKTVTAYFRVLLDKGPDRMFDVLELCEMLGVSDRTVRTCCDEILATSPVRYLRTQRMHMARHALAGADPLKATVTDIAISHGFSELGRFSIRYKAMFGERPSVTLRRPAA